MIKKPTIPQVQKITPRTAFKTALVQRIQENQQNEKQNLSKSYFKQSLNLKLYRLGEGDHIIDIIPYLVGENHPDVLRRRLEVGSPAYTLEVLVHRGIGPTEDKTVICLAEMYGKKCPVCQHRIELKSQGVDYNEWKHLYPKKRNLYNVVGYKDTNEEKKGVQLLDVAFHYLEKYLLNLCNVITLPGRTVLDPVIPFADPDEGKLVSFTIVPAKSKNDYPSFIGHKFVDRDYVISNELLDKVYTLDDIIHIPTYEEVYEIYWSKPMKKEEEEVIEVKTKETEYYDEKEVEKQQQEEIVPFEVDENSTTCPNGGVFGKDCNHLPKCENCKLWDKCSDSQLK